MTVVLVRRAGLMALLWWILAEGRQDGWLLGAVAVAAALWASMRLLPPADEGVRVTRLPVFLAFFVWNSFKGGVQVAWLSLRRRSALRPGVLELTLRLPPGAPRVLMVGTLGLMPGTLSVRLDDARLRVHVLDTRLPIVAEADELQAHVAYLFGGAAP